MHAKAAADAIRKMADNPNVLEQMKENGAGKLADQIVEYKAHLTARQVRKARAQKGHLPQPLRRFVSSFGR